MGQFYSFEGLKYLLTNALTGVSLTRFTAVTTIGSANIAQVSSFVGLAVGQLIEGDNIPAGTFIVDLDGSSGTILLSQAATASTPNAATSTMVAGGTLTQNLALTIHLLQGTIPQGAGVSFSNLTEASYDGYLPQLAVPPIVVNTPPPRNYAVAQFERQQYVPTDYTVPNTINGLAWTFTQPGASSPTLLAVEVFDAPSPLQQDGDILTVNPVLSLPFDLTAGVASPGVP